MEVTSRLEEITQKEEREHKDKANEVEAEDWIKFYRQNMLNERTSYYEKLGLERQEEHKPPMQIEKHFESGDYSLNFFVAKTNDDIRRSYLDKLISTGVLRLEPSKKYQCSNSPLTQL